MSNAALDTFKSRDDLKIFGSAGLGLFALQLKLGIEDISQIGVNSVVDGGDDKKADIIYLDQEQEIAVIIQSYISISTKHRKEAKANKASDLNTAMAWLFEDPNGLDFPERLKPHAKELQRSLLDGEIKTIYIWYVHNLNGSDNVKRELKVVERSTQAHIKSVLKIDSVKIIAEEIDQKILEEWYEAISTPILIKDTLRLPIDGGFSVKGPDWKAFVTSISLTWLHSIFKKYGQRLFSANIRDYLGSRDRDENINNNIRQTAETDANKFWIYNNGITILVDKIIEQKPDSLTISGISIVNGAQTTGAVGNLTKRPNKKAAVQVRFIESSSRDTILGIVKFNNSQNKTIAPDHKSNDKTQKRLETEFLKVSDLKYLRRRGGTEELIKRKKNALPSIVASQALAAFHGDPYTAYHRKTKIWTEDDLYMKYFSTHTTAAHIFVAYSLLKAVEKKKLELSHKSKVGQLTETEEEQFGFLKNRGSVILLTSAIASCSEIILGKKIPNLFRLQFSKKLTFDKTIGYWLPIVNSSIAFSSYLLKGLKDGTLDKDLSLDTMKEFRSLMQSTREVNATVYDRFSSKLKLG